MAKQNGGVLHAEQLHQRSLIGQNRPGKHALGG
jgi:hypothetical protein